MISLNLDSNVNYNKISSITKNQPAANGYVYGYVLKNAPKWTATDSVGIFLSNTPQKPVGLILTTAFQWAALLRFSGIPPKP